MYKNLLLLIVCLGLFHFVKGQPYDPKKFIKLHTVEEVYNLLSVYNIQDTFFIDKHNLRRNHTILPYISKEDVLKYGKMHKDAAQMKLEDKMYYAQRELINTFEEWVELVHKYPTVKASYYGKNNEKKEKFEDLIARVRSGEYMLVLKGTSNHFVYNNEEERENYCNSKILTINK
jgi:hypothetical protein